MFVELFSLFAVASLMLWNLLPSSVHILSVMTCCPGLCLRFNDFQLVIDQRVTFGFSDLSNVCNSTMNSELRQFDFK